MRRKILNAFFIVIGGGIGSILFYLQIKPSQTSLNITCAFCNPQIIDRQKFYEDDLVIALCTHKPIIPSHFLIIPKRHVKQLERHCLVKGLVEP